MSIIPFAQKSQNHRDPRFVDCLPCRGDKDISHWCLRDEKLNITGHPPNKARISITRKAIHTNKSRFPGDVLYLSHPSTYAGVYYIRRVPEADLSPSGNETWQ